MTVLKPISLESHVVHQSAPLEKQSSISTRMRGRSGKRSGGPDRNYHTSRDRSNSNPYQRPSSSRPSTSRQNDRGSSRPPARQQQQAPPPPPKQQPKSKPAPKQPAKKFSGKLSLNFRVLSRVYICYTVHMWLPAKNKNKKFKKKSVFFLYKNLVNFVKNFLFLSIYLKKI